MGMAAEPVLPGGGARGLGLPGRGVSDANQGCCARAFLISAVIRLLCGLVILA